LAAGKVPENCFQKKSVFKIHQKWEKPLRLCRAVKRLIRGSPSKVGHDKKLPVAEAGKFFLSLIIIYYEIRTQGT
jgi:hypothetical protein